MKMGNNARRNAEESYYINNMLSNIIDLYTNLT
jgi:hypothetical protein